MHHIELSPIRDFLRCKNPMHAKTATTKWGGMTNRCKTATTEVPCYGKTNVIARTLHECNNRKQTKYNLKYEAQKS